MKLKKLRARKQFRKVNNIYIFLFFFFLIARVLYGNIFTNFKTTLIKGNSYLTKYIQKETKINNM